MALQEGAVMGFMALQKRNVIVKIVRNPSFVMAFQTQNVANQIAHMKEGLLLIKQKFLGRFFKTFQFRKSIYVVTC